MKQRDWKSIFLFAIISVVASIVQHPERSHAQESERAPQIRRPLLVNLGLSSRPWNFNNPATIDHIDGLPFSGFSYNIPATWSLMRGSVSGTWTEQDLHNQFGGLNHSFANVNRNFVSVVIRKNGNTLAAGDFFDDNAWQTTINQFKLLARVAKTPKYQCVGIVFDNEEYFEDVWNYPADVAYAQQFSLEEYSTQAYARGRQVMQAIRQEWPAAVVMFLHGPYRSTPEDRPWEVSADQVGNFFSYELDAPFFFGMASSSRKQQLFDGGEVYQLRTAKQFRINYDWRKFELKKSRIVPQRLKPIYNRKIGIAHGLYNRTWPTNEYQMNPTIMRSTLRNALKSGDDNIWIFIESAESWLEVDGLPTDWRFNIDKAFQDATSDD